MSAIMSNPSTKRVTFSEIDRPPQKETRSKSTSTSRQVTTKAIKTAASASQRNVPAATGSTSSYSVAGARKPKAKKSLVRTSNFAKPAETAIITRSTSSCDPMLEALRLSDYPSSETIRQQNLAIPLMQSNLDTARKIKSVSELDLETAKTINKDFEINQEELIRKVSSLAVNVPSSECLYNDLVNVEFSDKNYKPKKYTHHITKEKTDLVPKLEDFVQQTNEKLRIRPKFPPISMSFPHIDLFDGRATLNARQNVRECSKKLLSFEGV